MTVFVCSAAVAAAQSGAPTSQTLSGLTNPRSVVENLNTTVKGKPFSATAVLHNTHTLADGSHINRTVTTLMYRDAEGRTRNETDGLVRIIDPAGFRIDLDPQNKVAYKSQTGGGVPGNVSPGGQNGWMRIPAEPKADASGWICCIEPSSSSPKQVAAAKKRSERIQTTDDLGEQMVNGVPAHGQRTILTIPLGAIGNDRPLTVATETWTSDALGVLVKSINSDPRFGTTVYELTNIVQAPPSPALFQIPGDYMVR